MASVFISSTDPNADVGPEISRISIAMMVLSGASVCLRLFSRYLAKAPLRWDDWTIVIACVLSWGTTTIHIVGVNYTNYGRHITPDISLNVIVNFLKCLYAVQILYCLTLATIKFSIILFYRRIFDIPQTKLPAQILFGMVIAWTIGTLLPAIFSCRPVYGFWDKLIEPQCTDLKTYFLGLAIPNVITDLILLVFPLPFIWKLKVSIPQKLGLVFIFSLGGFIIVASSLRLAAVVGAENSKDVTWSLVPLGVWNVIEMNLAIVLVNFPNMRPLVRACMGRSAVTGVSSGPGGGSGSRGVKNSKGSASRRFDEYLPKSASSFSRLHDFSLSRDKVQYSREEQRELEAGAGYADDGDTEHELAPINPPTAGSMQGRRDVRGM